MENGTVRVGIVGTGGMGLSRAELILARGDADLGWVCSRTEHRAREFIRTVAGETTEGVSIRSFSDWESAVADTDAHAILVCTPNTQHHAVVKAAIERGKHVLVEYPHATTAADGAELIALSRKHGVVLHVGLTHRYSGQHEALSRLIGEMGPPRAYQLMTCSGNPISRWYNRDELSGGMFVASLFHYIDEAMSIVGDVEKVSAEYFCKRDAEGVIQRDRASVMLSSDAGCVAQLSYARGFPKPGLGTVFSIICDNGYLRMVGGEIRQSTPEGEKAIKPESRDTSSIDTETFLDAVRTGTGKDDTAAQSQRTLEVAVRAQELAGGHVSARVRL